jgi:hypothetical protein
VNSLVVRNQKQIEIKQQHEFVEKLEQQPVQRKAAKICAFSPKGHDPATEGSYP